MTLTPTKAHDDCMPALAEIPLTLAKYGHAPVQVVFTDSIRGDKKALEQVFPSLLSDIVSMPSSSLKNLEIPSDWNVHFSSTTFQINTRMNVIMNDLCGSMDDGTRELHIPFDLEWPVDRNTGIYGRVALISIVYEKIIYLIRVRVYSLLVCCVNLNYLDFSSTSMLTKIQAT